MATSVLESERDGVIPEVPDQRRLHLLLRSAIIRNCGKAPGRSAKAAATRKYPVG